MAGLALIAACFLIGIALRWSGRLPENAASALNGFVIHVSLPALILLHLHRFPIDVKMLPLIAAPWLLFLFGAAFFLIIGRLACWSRQTTGGLILSGSLANTSFVGLPMIEAFYGVQFLGLGLFIDSLGTYLVLSTLGTLLAVGCAIDRQRLGLRAIASKVALFPPLIAVLLAMALRPVQFPETVEAALARLGATLVPVALVSVGYQVRFGALRSRLHQLSVGLAFKLILGPLLVGLVLVKLVGSTGEAAQVTIFEIAMAPQIGGAIVAMEHKLDPELVALMVALGLTLSFVTVPLWWYVLRAAAV
jgi:predicted permease